ncbi:hypothetical protein APSETT445_005083 [Aspergillus pseudonomiae]
MCEMSQKPEESKALQIPGLFPAKEEPVSAPPDYLLQRYEPVDFLPTFPVYYFFYGTLTSPAQLKRILDLPKEPQLRKAEVNGFAIAKWGDYPALINGKQEDVVTGSTYLVKSEEEAQKLSLL